MLSNDELKRLLISEINKINMNADFKSIGDSLDSLDRLELIENLERILGIELLQLINNKVFWSDLDQCSELLRVEIEKQ